MASVYYKSCYEDLLITVASRIKQKRGWHQNNHILTTLFINVKKKLILQEAIHKGRPLKLVIFRTPSLTCTVMSKTEIAIPAGSFMQNTEVP